MTPYDLETQRLRDFRAGFLVGILTATITPLIIFLSTSSRERSAPPSPVFRSPAPELRKSDLREPAGSYFVDGVEFCRI